MFESGKAILQRHFENHIVTKKFRGTRLGAVTVRQEKLHSFASLMMWMEVPFFIFFLIFFKHLFLQTPLLWESGQLVRSLLGRCFVKKPVHILWNKLKLGRRIAWENDLHYNQKEGRKKKYNNKEMENKEQHLWLRPKLWNVNELTRSHPLNVK